MTNDQDRKHENEETESRALRHSSKGHPARAQTRETLTAIKAMIAIKKCVVCLRGSGEHPFLINPSNQSFHGPADRC
jgi:hypothetical protein